MTTAPDAAGNTVGGGTKRSGSSCVLLTEQAGVGAWEERDGVNADGSKADGIWSPRSCRKHETTSFRDATRGVVVVANEVSADDDSGAPRTGGKDRNEASLRLW